MPLITPESRPGPEEHLLPLMVALGAAHDEPAARCHHEEVFFGASVVSRFRFG